MITLVGVGHIFDIAGQVRHVIRTARPASVGVELDPARYQAMLHPQDERQVPLPYRMLAATQRRMAEEFSGKVGGEMLAAVEEAGCIGAGVLFIDTDANVMFQRLWSQMSLRERVLLMLSGFTGLFTSRKKVEKEMENFQKNEVAYMDAVGRSFPTVKRVLIDERNEKMATAILQAEMTYGSVVAIIGDGHVEGIRAIIARGDVEIIRLEALQHMQRAEPMLQCTSDVTFQYEVGGGA
ncbi:MAG: TraB domain-containing protein [Methanomassiliicoccales archaeon]